MITFSARVRAVLLFYRGAAPFLLGTTGLLIGCVQLPCLLAGWTRFALPTLLFFKLLVAPAVWYLSEQQRPHQYWFYFNIGLSHSLLWGSVMGLDGLLFLTLAAALDQLFA